MQKDIKICVLGADGASHFKPEASPKDSGKQYDPNLEDAPRLFKMHNGVGYVYELLIPSGSSEFTVQRDLYIKNANAFWFCLRLNDANSVKNIEEMIESAKQIHQSDAIPPCVLVGLKSSYRSVFVEEVLQLSQRLGIPYYEVEKPLGADSDVLCDSIFDQLTRLQSEADSNSKKSKGDKCSVM